MKFRHLNNDLNKSLSLFWYGYWWGHKSVSSLVIRQTYNRTAADQSSDVHLHAYHRVGSASHFRSLHQNAESRILFSQHTTRLSDGLLIASWQYGCLMLH